MRFGHIFRLARTKIYELDPQASVVVGGLDAALTTGESGGVHKYAITEFLSNMGQPATMDAIGLHPYGPTLTNMLPAIRTLRTWMDANGLHDHLMHLTEWGWWSNSAADGISEAARATLFADAALILPQSDCGIAELTPHTWMTSSTLKDPKEKAFRLAWDYDVPIAAEDGGPGPAQAFGDVVKRQQGDTAQAPKRETVYLCDRDDGAPDQDGDDVEDQHDFAPLDDDVQDGPITAAPVV